MNELFVYDGFSMQKNNNLDVTAMINRKWHDLFSMLDSEVMSQGPH